MIRIAWAFALVALLSSCSNGTGEPPPADPVAVVKVATASIGAPAETVTLYGSASAGPASEVALASPTEAMIVAIESPPGTAVRAGQAVVTIKPGATVALDASKAANDAIQATAAYQRARRLRADGLMSDADVETARALAATASAARDSFTRRTSVTTLRAPAAGTVQMIGGSVGDVLAAGTPLARISKLGGAQARFGIDPALVRRINPGAAIRIAPATETGGYTVRVSSVDPVSDPQTRLASLYAPLPPASNIASGETLRGLVTIGRHVGAITIPYAAVLDDGGAAFVFVIGGGIAHRQPVTTGAEEAGLIEITAGLSQGAQVVTTGGTALEDGMKVRIVK